MMNIYRIVIFGLVTSFWISCQSDIIEDKEVEDMTYCLSDQLKKTTTIEMIVEQPIVEQLTLTGKVEYNKNDLLEFRSMLSGVVESVEFELGDYVKKGQVLATIRSSQIQELFQQKQLFGNQISLLSKQLSTQKELLEDGIVSLPEVLELENELSRVKIELERINFLLQMYRATGDHRFQILSPKNGYVIRKAMNEGQMVIEESEPLFTLSNLEEVWVMINIYASTLRYIHVGDEVSVNTVARPEEVYLGKIDRIYNVFDDNEHVLKAKVVLENKNLSLMPGLGADIIIDKTNGGEKATAIPKNSVVFSNNKEYVVLYKSDCNIEVRQVTPIASNDDYTYVKEYFGVDEQVISSNALLIFEELIQ